MRKEWTKRVISILLSFAMVVTLGVCSFSFESSAADNSSDILQHVFVMPYAEPDKDMDSGYVNILMQNKSNSNYVVRSYYWSITGTSDNTEVYMDVKMYSSSDVISFAPVGEVTWSLYEVRSATGACNQLISNASDASYMVDVSSTYDCLGIQGYGNIESTYPAGNSSVFTVLWAPDSVVYTQLQDIISGINDLETKLNTANTNLGTISTNITGLKTTVANIYNKLVAIGSDVTTIRTTLTTVSTTLTNMYTEMLNQGITLDNIDSNVDIIESRVSTMLTYVMYIHQLLLQQPADDKEAMEDFESTTQEQGNSISQGTQDMQTDKVETEQAGATVDEQIDLDSVGVYSTILGVVTNNSLVTQMLLIVFAISLIAYVLFGKRG